MSRWMLAVALLTAVVATETPAATEATDQGAAYPSKSIRLVVPFPPGGGTDIVARLIGPRLSQAVGQPVIIDNRAGAGGTIGSDLVAKAQPDGYTLAFATSSTHGVAPSLYKNLPYDAVEDFEQISLIATTPFMLAVKKGLPVASVQELIALARKQPGKLNFASAGVGSSNQLTMEMFKMMARVDIVHVPYKGSGPALADLVGGQVDLVINDMASLAGFVRAGQVKPLAVTSRKRNPLFPDVPTIDESGVPGYEAVAWYGLLAPRGTPPAIVRKLSDAVNKVLLDPELRKQFTEQGLQVSGAGPAELREYTKAEIRKWAAVVKASGARAE